MSHEEVANMKSGRNASSRREHSLSIEKMSSKASIELLDNGVFSAISDEREEGKNRRPNRRNHQRRNSDGSAYKRSHVDANKNGKSKNLNEKDGKKSKKITSNRKGAMTWKFTVNDNDVNRYSIKSLIKIIDSIPESQHPPDLLSRYWKQDENKSEINYRPGLTRHAQQSEMVNRLSSLSKHSNEPKSKKVYTKKMISNIISKSASFKSITHLENYNWGTNDETGPIIPLKGFASNVHNEVISNLPELIEASIQERSKRMEEIPKKKYSKKYLQAIFKSIPFIDDIPELASRDWGENYDSSQTKPIKGLCAIHHSSALLEISLKPFDNSTRRRDTYKKRTYSIETRQQHENERSVSNQIEEDMWDMPSNACEADIDFYSLLSQNTNAFELEHAADGRNKNNQCAANVDGKVLSILSDQEKTQPRTEHVVTEKNTPTNEQSETVLPFDDYINSLFSSGFSNILQEHEKVSLQDTRQHSNDTFPTLSLFNFPTKFDVYQTSDQTKSNFDIWSTPVQADKRVELDQTYGNRKSNNNSKDGIHLEGESSVMKFFRSVRESENEKAVAPTQFKIHSADEIVTAETQSSSSLTKDQLSAVTEFLRRENAKVHDVSEGNATSDALNRQEERKKIKVLDNQAKNVMKNDLLSILRVEQRIDSDEEANETAKENTKSSGFSFHSVPASRPQKKSGRRDPGVDLRGMQNILLVKKAVKGGQALGERKNFVPKKGTDSKKNSSTATTLTTTCVESSVGAQDQLKLLKNILQMEPKGERGQKS